MWNSSLKSLAVLMCLVAGPWAIGQDTNFKSAAATQQDARQQIEAVIASYTQAFNQRDVEKLASHWLSDGVYLNAMTGERVSGRDAIAAATTTLFSSDEAPKLSVRTESIELISPNVALERGVAVTANSGGDTTESQYNVIYVEHDGYWLIDRVTEKAAVEPPAQFEHLLVLEPLIGEWRHEGDDYVVDMSCEWTRNRSFISRTFKISNTNTNEVEASGLQVIGWDPHAEQIQSWLFDSDGGVVTGSWTQGDNTWIVTSVAALADGGKGSFTTTLRLLENGNLGWRKTNQVIDGKLLPNLDELEFIRQ